MTTTAAPIPTSTPARLGGDDRLVFTVAEAGDLLGISRAFAYELVARGELPVIRLGRRRLVPKVALLALVGAGGPPLAADPGSATDASDRS
jgi:excisionase family DNA binding protein